jgi:hypothetical protein
VAFERWIALLSNSSRLQTHFEILDASAVGVLPPSRLQAETTIPGPAMSLGS